MKLRFLLFVMLPAFVVSCESVNSRRAGGGAFDESQMGRTLDGNGVIPDPESPANQSFEDWRSID